MTDTIEAVARAIDPEAWAHDLPIPTRADTVAFHDRRQRSNSLARIAIAAHTKALIDGAGDVEWRLIKWADMDDAGRKPDPTSLKRQAAATIAALRAEIMRLTRAEALSELAAADAELLDYVLIADSDGDDGA